MIPETRLRDVIGRPVSAIAFVHDYVELHFDGPIVRALAAPCVRRGDVATNFPGCGSRDALCELIGRNVVNVIVREGEDIELRFDGDASVRIPLAEESRIGPEAAHFVPGENQPIEVW